MCVAMVTTITGLIKKATMNIMTIDIMTVKVIVVPSAVATKI
jgi:hypothetical protein